MIFCPLQDAERQIPPLPRLQQAIAWLRKLAAGDGEFSEIIRNLESGVSQKIAIDGDKVYAMLEPAKTIPIEEARMEYHEKYMDVQFMWDGEALLAIDSLAFLQAQFEEVDRIAERDVAFYPMPGSIQTVKLCNSWVAILFPGEPHAPRLSIDEPRNVKTVVIKVLSND